MKKVLMFAASWCGPCQRAKPIFEDMKNENKNTDVVYEIVDIDQNSELATNYGISGVPTFLVLEDSNEVNRFVGGGNILKLKEVL